MAASPPAPPKEPWDHDQATNMFGDDLSSQLLKGKAVVFAQQMAKFSEQLQNLVSSVRAPAPREALVRAWNEVTVALSVEGKSEQVLTGPAQKKALDGLQAKCAELEQTVSNLIAVKGSGSIASPAPSRHASLPPSASGSGKGKDVESVDADVFDTLRFRLAGSKRGHDQIEATPPPSAHLRIPSVPVRVPKLPAGNYTSGVARALNVCVVSLSTPSMH